MRLVGWVLLVGLAGSAGCASDGSSDACGGQARALCVQGCGADWVEEEVCRDGHWTCPGTTIRGDLDCPPGTCFNNPSYTECCSSSGERVPMYCDPVTDSLPSAGHCPDGYDVCSGADATTDAPPPEDGGEN